MANAQLNHINNWRYNQNISIHQKLSELVYAVDKLKQVTNVIVKPHCF